MENKKLKLVYVVMQDSYCCSLGGITRTYYYLREIFEDKSEAIVYVENKEIENKKLKNTDIDIIYHIFETYIKPNNINFDEFDFRRRKQILENKKIEIENDLKNMKEEQQQDDNS